MRKIKKICRIFKSLIDIFKGLWSFQSRGSLNEYNAYAMAGFILKNTLSENGGVTRGICKVDDGVLVDVVETSNIVKTESGVAVAGKEIDPESYVSMNMWGLPVAFMDVLKDGVAEFFEKDVVKNPLKSEYLLPTIISGMLRKGECTVQVLESKDKWFGVTYKEDKETVVNSFRELIDNGVYSEDLYGVL